MQHAPNASLKVPMCRMFLRRDPIVIQVGSSRIVISNSRYHCSPLLLALPSFLPPLHSPGVRIGQNAQDQLEKESAGQLIETIICRT